MKTLIVALAIVIGTVAMAQSDAEKAAMMEKMAMVEKMALVEKSKSQAPGKTSAVGEAKSETVEAEVLSAKLDTFCGIKLGEKIPAVSGDREIPMPLKKPFRLFKTAKLLVKEGRVWGVQMTADLPKAWETTAEQEKEFNAVVSILEKKYGVVLKKKRETPWCKLGLFDIWKRIADDEDKVAIDVKYRFNAVQSRIVLQIDNHIAWKKAATPEAMNEDEGADAL